MAEKLSPALAAANRRASHAPGRIVVGQVGVNHAQAATLVAAGFWEPSEVEVCKGKRTQRYRLTPAGRAALEPRDER